jgi:hypothetical protein
MVFAREMHLSSKHRPIGPDRLDRILHHERIQRECGVDRLRDELILRLHLATTVDEPIVIREQPVEQRFIPFHLSSIIVGRSRCEVRRQPWWSTQRWHPRVKRNYCDPGNRAYPAPHATSSASPGRLNTTNAALIT